MQGSIFLFVFSSSFCFYFMYICNVPPSLSLHRTGEEEKNRELRMGPGMTKYWCTGGRRGGNGGRGDLCVPCHLATHKYIHLFINKVAKIPIHTYQASSLASTIWLPPEPNGIYGCQREGGKASMLQAQRGGKTQEKEKIKAPYDRIKYKCVKKIRRRERIRSFCWPLTAVTAGWLCFCWMAGQLADCRTYFALKIFLCMYIYSSFPFFFFYLYTYYAEKATTTTTIHTLLPAPVRSVIINEHIFSGNGRFYERVGGDIFFYFVRHLGEEKTARKYSLWLFCKKKEKSLVGKGTFHGIF